MKKKSFRLGELIAMNDLPDSQLYLITDISERMLQLVYRLKNDKWTTPQEVDISLCQKPTKVQLANYQKQHM